MAHGARLLIAEDEERLRRLLEMLLGNKGYELTMAPDGAEAWEHFAAGHYDLVITDLRMPNMDGMELLRRVKAQSADTPVIVITAFGTIDNAVEAMQGGAIDYVTKPFEEARLNLSIERALEMGRLAGENRYLREQVRDKFNLGGMVAESLPMKRILEQVRAVAASRANVMVYGESGVGKELITRAIHDHSPRSHGAFVALNCAAIPDNLLESELFGHERGSFTGATERKIGRFEQADGGSLFLDEVGEMNLGIQAKVLRAIELQEFQRVGGTKTITTDVRFIAATNRDLRRAVREGNFREDLYFRLNVFPIVVPPLRERREDVVPLARFFLGKFCGEMGRKSATLSREAERVLLDYGWPGNVRELQNTIERSVIMMTGSVLTGEDVAMAMGGGIYGGSVLTGGVEGGIGFEIPPAGFKLEDHERMLLEQAMGRCQQNKSRAAKLLGISRATLRYRLDKFGLDGADEAEVESVGSSQ